MATSKLCGGYDFDAQITNHAARVVSGQRFGVNVTRHVWPNPDSIAHMENGMASHLRICLETINWTSTSYPSESLLSYVAARDLHEGPETLKLALGTLLNAVNSGMVYVGQRGELPSRLLWLLAKVFLFIRTEVKNVVT